MKQSEKDLYKKYTNEELLKLEKIFKKPLRFHTKVKEVKCLEDIFHKLVNERESTYNINFLSTLTKRAQCRKGASRSMEDIYRVAKYYIPNITLKDVYKAINRLKENCQLRMSYCHTVLKVVYIPYSGFMDTSLGDLNIQANDKHRSKDKS